MGLNEGKRNVKRLNMKRKNRVLRLKGVIGKEKDN
jgi:hypothetical protein